MLSSQTPAQPNTSGYLYNYFTDLFTKKRKLNQLELTLIPEIQANWQGILRSTITDQTTAETSLKNCYRFAGLQAPKIIWADHPLSVVDISIDRPDLIDVSGIILNQIWQSELKIQQSIDPAAAAVVFTNINPQHTIKTPGGRISIEQLTNAASNSVCQRLNQLVMSRIQARCGATAIDLTIPTALQDYRIGDLGYFDYFLQIGIDIPQLQPAIDLAKSCGWCWTFAGLAILTPKPTKIKIDRHGEIVGIIYNNVDILNVSKQS